MTTFDLCTIPELAAFGQLLRVAHTESYTGSHSFGSCVLKKAEATGTLAEVGTLPHSKPASAEGPGMPKPESCFSA